jgi:hypothetical protein
MAMRRSAGSSMDAVQEAESGSLAQHAWMRRARARFPTGHEPSARSGLGIWRKDAPSGWAGSAVDVRAWTQRKSTVLPAEGKQNPSCRSTFAGRA